MKKEFNQYANTVISYLECDEKTRRRIKEDIVEMLYERQEASSTNDPYELLGDPYTISQEFEENIPPIPPKRKVYITPWSIFGLPLLHISFTRNVVAKGIVAIGYRSVGIVSIGAVSIGLISIGAVSVGIFALGGLALAVSSALGGLAIAYDIAIGGLAIAKSLAIGGVALAGDIAIGGMTSATLTAYMQANIPPLFERSASHAFQLPSETHAFRSVFDRLFDHFGRAKTFIIHNIFS